MAVHVLAVSRSSFSMFILGLASKGESYVMVGDISIGRGVEFQ